MKKQKMNRRNFLRNSSAGALGAGVNFIETSEMYGRGNQGRSIGKVIRDFKREDLFLLSKISHRDGEYHTVAEVISRAEASLERLQTDYLDCYMIHGADNSEMVKNEVFHEAMDELQKAGKVRFRGASCHGHSWWDNPKETDEEVLMTALEKYIRLSGTTLDEGKLAMLDDFMEMCGPLQCRIGCNLCEEACPHGVLIRPLLTMAHQNLNFDSRVP